MKEKRVFGYFEVVFDTVYLCVVCLAGVWLLFNADTETGLLAGGMALILGMGDAFHLIPRIVAILTGKEDMLHRILGLGKLVASITMTVFYVLLWYMGRIFYLQGNDTPWTAIVYVLAILRIVLCFFPQNRWADRKQPVRWGIYRNIPFFLLGAVVTVFFWTYRTSVPELNLIWLAVTLSFVFYFPVVVWIHKSPKLGMLMFPKTCAYIWMILMFLGI